MADDYVPKTGPLEYGYHPLNLLAEMAVRARTDLSVKAKYLYGYLLYRQGTNDAVWMERKDMMKHNGMTKYQVDSALNELLHAKDEEGEDCPLMENTGQMFSKTAMTRVIMLMPPLPSKNNAIYE